MIPPTNENEASLLVLHTSCGCKSNNYSSSSNNKNEEQQTWKKSSWPSSPSTSHDYDYVDDGLLLLDPSCGDNINDGENNNNIFRKPIDELSVICDILILPENSHNNQHVGEKSNNNNNNNGLYYIEMLETKFNPCGYSNVLVLQDNSLSWDDEEKRDGGLLLLSLTSCRIEIEVEEEEYGNNSNNNNNNNNNQNQQIILPVEPIPSTFEFTLDNHHEIEDDDEGEDDSHNHQYSSSASTTLVGEISVQFDLSYAARRLSKLMIVEEEKLSSSSSSDHSKKDTTLSSNFTAEAANISTTTSFSTPIITTDDEPHSTEAYDNNNDSSIQQCKSGNLAQKSPSSCCCCTGCEVMGCEQQQDIPKLLSSFYMDMCLDPILRQEQQCNNNIKPEQQPILKVDHSPFEQRLDELLRLQERMDQETDYLNHVFGLLSMLGLFLLGLLFWMIFRLFRQVDNEDKFTRLSLRHKLQLLCEENIDVLQNNVVGPVEIVDDTPNNIQETIASDELTSPIITVSDDDDTEALSHHRLDREVEGSEESRMEPVCLDSILEQAANADDSNTSMQDEATTSTSSGGEPNMQVPVRSEGIFGIPPRQKTSIGNSFSISNTLDFTFAAAASKDGDQKESPIPNPPRRPSVAPPYQGSAVSVSGGKHLVQVPNTSEENVGVPDKTAFSDPIGFTIQGSTLVTSKGGGLEENPKATNSPGQGAVVDQPEDSSSPKIEDPENDEGSDSKDLSPCSKLAQEWAAKKTVRRHNRTRKQSLLQPNLPINANNNSGDHPSKIRDQEENSAPVTPPRARDLPRFQSISKNGEYSSDSIPVFQNDSTDLSPCTKLAQDWAASKTVRRNNRRRKKKHNPLQPHPRVNSSEEPSSSKTDSPGNSPSQFAQDEVVIGPPSVRSTLNGEGFSPQLAMIQRVGGEASSDVGENSSSSDLIEPLPGLCTTPTSEEGDTSFVDDYW